MSKILVTLNKSSAHLPTGIEFDHTDIDVVDSAGAKSTQAVNGSEVPAWSGAFDVADGAGTVVATDRDTEGNAIGAPLTQAFDTLAGTFPSTVGITVTPQ